MSRATISRNALKAAVEATADKNGIVVPDRVVEAARDESSVLHGQFEWDDSIAAHQHRLDVARSLIREIRYESYDSTKKTITEVSYVHDPRQSKQAYIPLNRVARNKKLAQAVMEAELARCSSAINRAREVADVLELRDVLDDLLAQLVVVQEKVKTPASRRRGSSAEIHVSA